MLNSVVLIGRLTKDPELKYTPSGVAVTTFTLAVDRAFSKDETDFISIVVWRASAEHCANYLRKGRLAAVRGRIQVRSYDNKEGKRQYVTEVVAEEVKFLERSDSGQANKPADPFHDDGKPIEILDSDLPF